jgi:hypothetical protein
MANRPGWFLARLPPSSPSRQNQPYSCRRVQLLCESFRTGYSHPTGAIVRTHDAAAKAVNRRETLRSRRPVHIAVEVRALRACARSQPGNVCANRRVGSAAHVDFGAIAMLSMQRTAMHSHGTQSDEARPMSQSTRRRELPESVRNGQRQPATGFPHIGQSRCGQVDSGRKPKRTDVWNGESIEGFCSRL